MNKILESIKEFFRKIKLPAVNLKRLTASGAIFWGITLVLAIGGFILVRNLATCLTVLNLPGVAPANCAVAGVNPLGTPVMNAQGTPISANLPTPIIAAPDVEYPLWDGASRVNILFMGLDYRDYIANEGPPRTDTMILFTIDPSTKTAGMLSIPRDLWVNIPGFGYSRINTAYSSGEGNKLPGGGPGLAVKTVEQLLGVPIHYFGEIDFHSFEEVIDTMGGLYICIPQRIHIDPIGNKPPKNLHAGCQTLWGYEVLAYSRQRYTAGGDTDRSKRQQLVIRALRNQIFSPQNFPHMMQLAPDIYTEAQAGLVTNMSFQEALKLGALLQQIPPSSIKSGVIDDSMVTFENTTLNGQPAAVLKPIMDKITVLRDDIFAGGAVNPMASGDPVSLMQADAARVRVLNGSFTQGLDQRTGNYLLSKGVQVVEIGPADRAYDQTMIIMYNPKLYTFKYLITELGITGNAQIVIKADPAATVDIEIRVGNDWAPRIPAGF